MHLWVDAEQILLCDLRGLNLRRVRLPLTDITLSRLMPDLLVPRASGVWLFNRRLLLNVGQRLGVVRLDAHSFIRRFLRDPDAIHHHLVRAWLRLLRVRVHRSVVRVLVVLLKGRQPGLLRLPVLCENLVRLGQLLSRLVLDELGH